MFALFAPAMSIAQVSVPYSAEFDGTQTDWTVVDKSETLGRSWDQWSNYNFGGDLGSKACVMMQDEYYSAPNDYYVSPAIQVEAGKTYAVKLHGVQQYSNFHGTLTTEIGTDKEDMSTFKVIGTHEPETTDNAEFNDEYKFTAETTGTVYVAFHATECQGMDKYVYYYLLGTSIEESTADPTEPGGGTGENPDQPDVTTESLPFYQNFVFEDSEGKWKIVDNSSTAGSTFSHIYMYDSSVGQNWGYGIKDDDYGANDYLISPAFKLEAGKTYTLDFTHQAYSYSGTLSLGLGTERDDVSSFSTIYTASRQEDSNHNGDKIEDTYDFTVEKDGVYYIAFHATPDGADETYYTYVNINDFMLKEKENGGGSGGGDEEPDMAIDVPYSVDFSDGLLADNWKTLDASQKTGSTWTSNEYGYTEYDENWNAIGDPHPCVTITTDFDSDINDYLVSPAFNMKEGKTYVVKLHTAATSINEADLSLEVATDRKDASTYNWVATITSPVAYDSEDKDREYEIEINKDGVYYIALHARTWEKEKSANLNLFSFSVEEKVEAEDEAVALPYTADFTKASDTESGDWDTWTKLDRSDNAGSTWSWGDGSFITFDENYNAGPTSLGSYNMTFDNSNFNDYLVSPAVNLEAGKTYVVNVQAFTREYSDIRSLELELGTEKKVSSSYKKVGDIELNVALLESEYQAVKDVVSTNEITVDADGKYYFAIHGAAEENKSVYAYVLSFDVKEKSDPETRIGCITNVAADTESTVYTLDGRRTGNLSSLSKGTYIVKTRDAFGKVKSVKVMK